MDAPEPSGAGGRGRTGEAAMTEESDNSMPENEHPLQRFLRESAARDQALRAGRAGCTQSPKIYAKGRESLRIGDNWPEVRCASLHK